MCYLCIKYCYAHTKLFTLTNVKHQKRYLCTSVALMGSMKIRITGKAINEEFTSMATTDTQCTYIFRAYSENREGNGFPMYVNFCSTMSFINTDLLLERMMAAFDKWITTKTIILLCCDDLLNR